MSVYYNSLSNDDQSKFRDAAINAIDSHVSSIDEHLANLPSVPDDLENLITPADYEQKLKESKAKLLRQRSGIRGGFAAPDDIEVQDFLPEAFSGKGPVTDQLANYLAERGTYDALRTNNVFDGGGGEIPATTTVAVFDPDAIKSDENAGTFSPRIRNIYRAIGPAMLGGSVLAAAMGRPSGASASTLPSGWVPPSAKSDLSGMDPGWLDPVGMATDAVTGGVGGTLSGLLQSYALDQIPRMAEIDVPEEYYEAAQ